MELTNTITRYVLAELLKIFLATLFALCVFLILVIVVHEGMRNGLTPNVMLRLIPYVLPNALCFAIPGTILFAACSVYGRMSAANEIVALKSLGISPTVIVMPALLLACLLSLVTVCLIDIAFSWGYWGTRRVVVTSLEEIAYSVLRTQRNYSSDQFFISVSGVDGRRLLDPTITFAAHGDSPSVTINAREAEFKTVPNEGALTVVLTDGEVEVDNKVTLRFPDTIQQTIPLADSLEDEALHGNPSHLRLAYISTEIRQQRQIIERQLQTLAAEAAIQMTLGDFRELTGAQWPSQLQQLESLHNRMHRLNTEPYRRWASGFSCLCFVVLGAPLAIRLRSADYMMTFGVCFLPILVVFYPLFMFGVDRAKEGALPPYCVWLSNVVCSLIGVWMYEKVLRH